MVARRDGLLVSPCVVFWRFYRFIPLDGLRTVFVDINEIHDLSLDVFDDVNGF